MVINGLNPGSISCLSSVIVRVRVVFKTSVTNNSLSEDYPHPELDSEDDYRSGSQNISHQQQSF